MTNLVVDKGVISLRNCTDLRMEWEEMTLFMKCHELWSWRWIFSLYILFVSFCSRPSLPAQTKTKPNKHHKGSEGSRGRFLSSSSVRLILPLRRIVFTQPRCGVSPRPEVESVFVLSFGDFWCWFGVGIFWDMTFSMNLRQQQKHNTYVIWMLHDWFIDVAWCYCYIILHSFYMSMNINM